MRKSLVVLLTGSVLSGCLDSGSSDVANNDSPSAVQPVNSSPTISGEPPISILYGEAYAFQPSANDPDGDVLTFQIANGPAWASFDSSTGLLSGTPELANVGFYDDIAISVSDGKASSSLSAFAITVLQSASGNITLSWVAPTQNSDGSALVDLSGYNIYYGRSSGSYDSEIRVDNASVTTYVVEELSPDTYYFATTAFNSQGVESSYSAEAAGTVF